MVIGVAEDEIEIGKIIQNKRKKYHEGHLKQREGNAILAGFVVGGEGKGRGGLNHP